MSIVIIPSGLCVAAEGGLAWGQQRYDVTGISDPNGASQTRVFGPPRWTVSLRAPQYLDASDAAAWESMILRTRGRVNHLAVYNLARDVPRGTFRGTLSLKVAISAGDTTATFYAGDAGTLLRGDMIQIGSGVGTSQLVKLTFDAETSPATVQAVTWTRTGGAVVTWTRTGGATVSWYRTGTIAISFEPPARIDFPILTAGVWNRPVAYFKSTSDATSWGYYSTTGQTELRWDGIEDWSP